MTKFIKENSILCFGVFLVIVIAFIFCNNQASISRDNQRLLEDAKLERQHELDMQKLYTQPRLEYSNTQTDDKVYKFLKDTIYPMLLDKKPKVTTKSTTTYYSNPRYNHPVKRSKELTEQEINILNK